MPDQIFADPRLAAIYDDIDSSRAELAHHEAIVDELGAAASANLRSPRLLAPDHRPHRTGDEIG